MTLDIIIACLGDGNGYLQDCLDSIAAQVFKDVRIILEKDDPQAPLGVAAMRNRGLDAAESDYVMFMDCDDYLSRTALTVGMYEALKNPGSIIRINRRRCCCRYSTSMALEDSGHVSHDRQEHAVPSGFYDTCLGQLIPRVLLDGLRFDEGLRYYSDIPFLAQLYGRSDVVVADEVSYYKRIHNDPAGDPSLDQEVSPARFPEYCTAMRLAAGYMADSTLLAEYICQFLVSRTVVGRAPKGRNWSDADIAGFCGLVKDVAYPAVKSFRGESARVLKAFSRGRVKHVRRLVVRHCRRLRLHDMCTIPHQRRLMAYRKLFLKLPLQKDTVLFSSFFGKSYCDSCRAIYEYMLKEYPNKKYVWMIEDDSAEIPGRFVRVRKNSLKYYYYLAVAGLYVNNVRQPEWYVKREGAFLLQTWHGTPLKRLVCDLEDVFAERPAEYKKIFCKQAGEWDRLLSDNAFSTEAFAGAFRYPKERILELGYPRNDVLFAPDAAERAAELKKKLGLPLNKKIVLYAPTWRDDEAGDSGECGFTMKLNPAKLKPLSDRYHFVLRLHYLISENLFLSEKERRYMTDLSSYGDISELYLLSDVLITDYSSVFFDYANLNRPILFYVYDLEKYRDELHGFYFPMEEECPGPMLKTTAQVADALNSLDRIRSDYAGRYAAFREKYCSLDDGHATERAVNAVLAGMKEKGL